MTTRYIVVVCFAGIASVAVSRTLKSTHPRTQRVEIRTPHAIFRKDS